MNVSFIGYVLFAILAHLVWSELICNPFQGMCEGIFLKLEMHVNTRRECAEVCRQTSDCAWFSFDEESRLCFAMETCIKEDTDYQRFYSAPVVLHSDCKCGIMAHCDHGHLVEFFNITSPVDCLHQCHIDAEHNCNWVTYNVATGACFLFHQCSYGFNVTYPYSISAHKDCSMNSVPDQNNLNELKQRLGLLPQGISTEKYGDYSDYVYNGTDVQKEDMRRKRETVPVNGIEELDAKDFLLAISNDSIDSLATSNGTGLDIAGNSAITTLSTAAEDVPTLDNNDNENNGKSEALKEKTKAADETQSETDEKNSHSEGSVTENNGSGNDPADSDNDLLLRIIFKK
jgi:hypothetical protein